MILNTKIHPKRKIAIIGGGIAGSTAAIHLSEMGLDVTLLEKGPSLVNGPPICHLHAGGNLYREISEQQCLELLRQSIETVRLYPHSLNIRPTVIAVPHSDGGDPNELLPRLKSVANAYQSLVEESIDNQVLGDPKDYYKLYSLSDLQELALKSQPKQPRSMDDWVIPFAQYTDLSALKYPVVAVQEFGMSVFRLSATANIALERNPNCTVMTETSLTNAQWNQDHWTLSYEQVSGHTSTFDADFLINASGFETGKIDDYLGKQRDRLVEFKAAYVTHWPDCSDEWPEVIFHGPRGTPQGMAQLTPYADGYFQLHGMTEGITLFEDGLVTSDSSSSQPQLPKRLLKKIDSGWSNEVIHQRSTSAIEHMSQFIPSYMSSTVAGKPLFGAQQIPGSDPSLRAADVSFEGERYARIEVVKASSALEAARKISTFWFDSLGFEGDETSPPSYPVTCDLSRHEVEERALQLAKERHYPQSLAKISGVESQNS